MTTKDKIIEEIKQIEIDCLKSVETHHPEFTNEFAEGREELYNFKLSENWHHYLERKAELKGIQSQKQKIENWEKLFEEEQTGREQAQEEVRNLKEELKSQKQKIIEEIKSLDYDEMMSEDMETVDKKMFYESSMTEEDLESVKKYILKILGEKEQCFS